jgi:hypothetical protein
VETGERQNLSFNHPQIKWNQTSARHPGAIAGNFFLISPKIT